MPTTTEASVHFLLLLLLHAMGNIGGRRPASTVVGQAEPQLKNEKTTVIIFKEDGVPQKCFPTGRLTGDYPSPTLKHKSANKLNK